jgi:TonB family protein
MFGLQTPAAAPQLVTEDVPAIPRQTVETGLTVVAGVVQADGKMADIRLLSGQPPFVEPSTMTVRDWSFDTTNHPVHQPVSAVFLYRPQTVLSARSFSFSLPVNCCGPNDTRPPVPTTIVDPGYPVDSVGEGSVIMQLRVDVEGVVQAVDVIRRAPSLEQAAVQAVRSWHFSPAMQNGIAVPGTCIAVITFQRPVLSH